MFKAAAIIILVSVLSPLIVISQSSALSPEEEPAVVEFSLEGGFYEHPLELRLVSPGAAVYYTTNGVKPDRKSKRYRGPIEISSTTVVRAVAYRDGDRGPTTGHTYFISEPATTLPVVSIGIPSWVLFDREKG